MRRPFPIYPPCPVCGDPERNPATLAVRWWWDPATSRVVGCFTPTSQHVGYANRLHGGLTAALFDEAMAWACAVARRSFCSTGELTVRYQRPIALGHPVEIAAWVTVARGPYLRAEGSALAAGIVVARARGTYATMSREESRALEGALRRRDGDMDIFAEAQPSS